MKGFPIEKEVERLRDEVFFLRFDAAIRVEGPDDVLFWQKAFHEAAPAKKIRIFAESNYPTPGSTGKTNVLKFKRFASKDLLLCVDSDYDYLLQSATITGLPFVFHTYAFAIENFKCNPASLREIYIDAGGNPEVAFDFPVFFKAYSAIISPLFLLSVFSEKENSGVFDLKKCGAEVCPPPDWLLELTNEKWMEKMELRTAERATEIESRLKNSIPEDLKNLWMELGATPENTCWFVRGHNWIEFVEQLLAVSVYRSKQTNWKQDTPIPEEEIEHFKAIKNSVKSSLHQNSNFSDGAFFEKILTDIRAVFSDSAN